MKILSLFDGMSCGRIALERAGIKVDKYFASEIDKYAIQVSQKNYPDIIQLGDVNNWRDWDIGEIDMIIGGSPCQGFSFAGKQLAFNDPRSKLFFTMVDIINHYKPKYFLLENVKMKKEFQKIITEYMGVEPIEINSAKLSAQNRKRLYWTNIPGIEQPEDKGILLKDILEESVDEKYYLSEQVTKKIIGTVKIKDTSIAVQYYNSRQFKGEDKLGTLGTGCGSWSGKQAYSIIQLNNPKHSNNRLYSDEGKSPTLNSMQGGHRQPKIIQKVGDRDKNNRGIRADKPYCLPANAMSDRGMMVLSDRIRKLTPIECERLQTVPDNYTEKGVEIVKDLCKIKKNLSFNKTKGLNVVLNDVKERQLGYECAICTEEDLINTEAQIYQKYNYNQIKNVNFVITKYENQEQGECVQNIIKICKDTETHYILTKLESIIEIKSQKIDTTEVIVEETDTGYLWKIICEGDGKNERLFIILTLIRQIIQKKIFTFVNQEASIHGYIDNLKIFQENLLGLELYVSKMENIISVSNTQRYKMLGNGWTVDVIAHIFSFLPHKDI